MRWNGVFVLGLGLTAIGFAAMGWTYSFGPPHPAAAKLSVAVLAIGALVACLGTLLNRPRAGQSNARRRGSRLFGGSPSRTGTFGRNFGQRKDYGALPPMGSEAAGPKIDFKKPGGSKQPQQKAEARLAIEGPQ
jgi:hypothetical protein